ncbi:MAG: putative ABC transporter ATP-binding protein [Planctomycetes bacterium ADurb.Bin412]|nr:MAG: putative ABC transporter ATP-binding protein [Planctomycetes bacterium ADurb.Bin412]
MSDMRRVLAIDGRGEFVVIEQPVPELAPGRVRLRVRASLVSPGTELGGVPARRANPKPDAAPQPFGYSNAGEVVALGEGVTRFRVGERIACIGAGYAQHASEAVVPQNLCIALPDELSFADGAFGMLAATALHAVRRAGPEIGEHFLIAGLGPVGQLSAQWARAAGTHVMAWDRLPLRLEVARKYGCDRAVNVAEEDPVAAAAEFTRGHGMDAGIIAFGGDGTEAFKQIVRTLKLSPDTHRMGRVVIVGGASIASRAYVARFNFRGAQQQKKTSECSGGERNRIHLAKMLRYGGNLLLLDEPTNDLDVDTMRVLEQAIIDFQGCAMVISHDRFFLDRICTHLLIFEGSGKILWFQGNFAAYEEKVQAESPDRVAHRRGKYKQLKLK